MKLPSASAARRLRQIRFLVIDWAKPGDPFTAADFDRLVTAGYVLVDRSADSEAA